MSKDRETAIQKLQLTGANEMFTRLICWIDCALRDRKGISAMEYAVLGAAIIVAVGAAATTLSNGLSEVFTNLVAKLTNAVNNPGG